MVGYRNTVVTEDVDLLVGLASAAQEAGLPCHGSAMTPAEVRAALALPDGRVLLYPADVTGHAIAPRLGELGLIERVVALVPDIWLEPTETLPTPQALRAAYVDHLQARLAAPQAWLPQAPDPSHPADGAGRDTGRRGSGRPDWLSR